MRLLNRLWLNYYSQRNFTPKSISGLALWLDASDLGTITKDGSNYVSEWRDKSGNAKHFTQATGGAQPLWGSNLVTFDGTGDFLNNATLPTANAMNTIIAKLKFTSTARMGILGGLLDSSTIYANGGKIGAGTNGTNNATTDTHNSGAEIIVSITSDTLNTYSIKIANTAKTLGNDAGYRGSVTLNLGAAEATANTWTLFFAGSIKQVIGYTGVLPDAELTKIYNYLVTK